MGIDGPASIALTYTFISSIPYFRSGKIAGINQRVRFIATPHHVRVVLDASAYTVHLSNGGMHAIHVSRALDGGVTQETCPAQYEKYIDMIGTFDVSDMCGQFEYAHSETQYTNDVPMSGIYGCFFFCGYIGTTPVHQIVGQYDRNLFFAHHPIDG